MKKSWNRPAVYNLGAEMTEFFLYSTGADASFEEAADPSETDEVADITGSTKKKK